MNIILSKYYHYPELHVNLKIILISITTSIPNDLLTDAAKMLDIPKSVECFEPYRNKMRGLSLILNNLHINEIYNISNLIENNSNIKEDQMQVINDINNDFSMYYLPSVPEENFRSKYEDFKTKKQKDIEMHEVTLKIGQNLTKVAACSKHLITKTCFVDDLLDFLVYFARGEILNGETKDIVDYITAIKNKKSNETIKITLLNILDLTLSIFTNFLNADDESINDSFISKVLN